MADIVPFTAPSEKPEGKGDPSEMIWTCTNCNCISFFLRADGSTECCGCGNRGEDTLWMEHRPGVTVENTLPKEKAPEYTDSIIAFARSPNVVSWLQDRVGEDTVAVILLRRTGTVAVWQSDDFTSCRKWLADQMKTAMDYLLGRPQEVDTGDDCA